MRRLYSQIYSAFSLTFILLTHKISMYNQLNNKLNHTKAHHFYLLSTYNSEHIILISSQKNCTGTSVNQMNGFAKKIFEVRNLLSFFFSLSSLLDYLLCQRYVMNIFIHDTFTKMFPTHKTWS